VWNGTFFSFQKRVNKKEKGLLMNHGGARRHKTRSVVRRMMLEMTRLVVRRVTLMITRAVGSAFLCRRELSSLGMYLYMY